MFDFNDICFGLVGLGVSFTSSFAIFRRAKAASLILGKIVVILRKFI